MTQSARDLESTFGRALQLLVRNWFIIIPGLVLAVAGAALSYAIVALFVGSYAVSGDGSADAAAIPSLISAILTLVMGILIAILQLAFVTGMAGGSWKHGKASFRDGWAAFSHRSIQTFIALLVLFVIGFCATALIVPTFYLSLVAYVIFFVYTMASVIIGRNEAIAGLAESCRMALANFLPTLAVVALVFAISWLGARIGDLIGQANPLLGSIAAAVLQQAIVAYAALVIVGEYLKLRATPDA